MKKERWVVAAVVLALGMPSAWAERTNKPKPPAAQPKPPAGGPGNGLKPPPGKPKGEARSESGKMVRLEGGTFQMGSEDGDADEKPVHSVTVASFWMDETEVTVAAYKACVDAGSCSKPDDDGSCNWGKSDRSNHPINCVDWTQATAFCRWANKRLPTEEEWEYAAKPGGSKGGKYPWGEAEPSDQLCWKRWNGGGSNALGTCAVGSYPSGNTTTGLKDMAGNVWEWTSSLYCPYTDSGYNVGKCGSDRVNRGGCWSYDYASLVRGANRYWYTPSIRTDFLGFRCARADLFYPFTGPVSNLTPTCEVVREWEDREIHEDEDSNFVEDCKQKSTERSEVFQKKRPHPPAPSPWRAEGEGNRELPEREISGKLVEYTQAPQELGAKTPGIGVLEMREGGLEGGPEEGVVLGAAVSLPLERLQPADGPADGHPLDPHQARKEPEPQPPDAPLAGTDLPGVEPQPLLPAGLFELVPPGGELGLVVAEEEHVIHVAKVSPDAEAVLGPVIHGR